MSTAASEERTGGKAVGYKKKKIKSEDEKRKRSAEGWKAVKRVKYERMEGGFEMVSSAAK